MGHRCKGVRRSKGLPIVGKGGSDKKRLEERPRKAREIKMWEGSEEASGVFSSDMDSMIILAHYFRRSDIQEHFFLFVLTNS